MLFPAQEYFFINGTFISFVLTKCGLVGKPEQTGRAEAWTKVLSTVAGKPQKVKGISQEILWQIEHTTMGIANSMIGCPEYIV